MGPFPVDTCLSEGLLCLGASCQEEGRKFLSASFPAGWGGGRAVEMLRAGRCFRPDCGGNRNNLSNLIFEERQKCWWHSVVQC